MTDPGTKVFIIFCVRNHISKPCQLSSMHLVIELIEARKASSSYFGFASDSCFMQKFCCTRYMLHNMILHKKYCQVWYCTIYILLNVILHKIYRPIWYCFVSYGYGIAWDSLNPFCLWQMFNAQNILYNVLYNLLYIV